MIEEGKRQLNSYTDINEENSLPEEQPNFDQVNFDQDNPLKSHFRLSTFLPFVPKRSHSITNREEDRKDKVRDTEKEAKNFIMWNVVITWPLFGYLLIWWAFSKYYSDERNLDCKMRTDYACIMFCLCVLTPQVLLHIVLLIGFYCYRGESRLAARRKYGVTAENVLAFGIAFF